MKKKIKIYRKCLLIYNIKVKNYQKNWGEQKMKANN